MAAFTRGKNCSRFARRAWIALMPSFQRTLEPMLILLL